MKLTPLALLVAALFSTAALAQQAAPAKAASAARTPAVQLANPVAKTAAATAPVASQPAVAAAPAAAAVETNPFTGKSMTVEQIQLKLEEAKLQTQTLEEMLKQTTLQQEMQNVPLRKAVEAAQARTNIKKEETQQAVIDEQVKASKKAEKASEPAKPVKKTAKQKAAEKAAEEAAAQARATAANVPPPMPRPTLLSVMEIGGSRSVVLDFGGATLVAADGDMTPSGPVRVLDAGSASVGGEVYKVRTNTLSRFVVSDPKPVDPKAAQGSPMVTAPGASGVGTSAGAGVLPPLPGQVGAPAASSNSSGAPIKASMNPLPALQLPPGLTSLPAPK